MSPTPTAALAVALAALGALGAACGPDLPETPTFEEHVRPILVAQCARCHETPSIGGAPGFSVLDYDDVVEQVELGLLENQLLSGAMPPTQELDDWELDLLLCWIAIGAPR